jgi:hypothetical protein
MPNISTKAITSSVSWTDMLGAIGSFTRFYANCKDTTTAIAMCNDITNGIDLGSIRKVSPIVNTRGNIATAFRAK